jgi:integrase-like protein
LVQRGSPLITACIAHRLERWGQALGIRLSPHRLRHTYATRLLNAGVPIASLQKTLGHRSLDKTVLYARIADPVVEGLFDDTLNHQLITLKYELMAGTNADVDAEVKTRASAIQGSAVVAKDELG